MQGPLAGLGIVGLIIYGGVKLLMKLDKDAQIAHRKKFEKDVAYLKAQGFNNHEIAHMLRGRI